jgi:DNA mismatch repair protein MutS2
VIRIAAPVGEELRPELNILGCRLEEAIQQVDRFLDQISLQGVGEVRIVHGKGTGALKRGVREFLSDNQLVREFRGGDPLEGGEGVTIVMLR